MNIRNYQLRLAAFLLAGAILFSSCVSTTMIQSVPDNAKLFINGEPVGETPYSHSDEEIIFTNTDVRLEKDGYEPFYGSFTRSEEVDAGPLIGGIFLCPVFLLWVLKYKPTHTFEMVPLNNAGEEYVEPTQGSMTDQKAEKLRQIKSLLDEGVLTPEEYEREKAKILDEE
jgi:hypothetical protein